MVLKNHFKREKTTDTYKNTTMKFCPHCRLEFYNNEKFCLNCGSQLVEKPQNVSSYYLVLNGAQAGPYPMEQLAELKKQGIITKETYAWKEGMANWEFAGSIEELKALFTVAPPPMPSMPPMPPAMPGAPAMPHCLAPQQDAEINKQAELMAMQQDAEINKQAELMAMQEYNRQAELMAMQQMHGNDLTDLCQDIKGQTYIETLNLNRSWVLPKFVEMGFGNGKEFDTDKYIKAIHLHYYDHIWTILLRNYEYLSRTQNKNSTTYRIRKGWWSKETAAEMATFDLQSMKNYFDSKPRAAKNWELSRSKKLNNVYADLNSISNEIAMANDDGELLRAITKYNNRRQTTDRHVSDGKFLILPPKFLNAYMGDGAFSSMMTMVKYLGLRCCDYYGRTMSREECITEIANIVFDNNFNGGIALSYCVEKFFDSGVFNYREYKR